jgi:hypothetical protein
MHAALCGYRQYIDDHDNNSNTNNDTARLLCCMLWPQVHARNKSVDPTINWQEVARAMSGFTGAIGWRPSLHVLSE